MAVAATKFESIIVISRSALRHATSVVRYGLLRGDVVVEGDQLKPIALAATITTHNTVCKKKEKDIGGELANVNHFG